MTANDLATQDIRDQFSAYVDPRNKDTKNYHEHAADFDAWLENLKTEARAQGYIAGRVDGIEAAAKSITAELDSNLERSVVVGSEARAYRASFIISKSIVERVTKRLALAAKG